MSRQGVRLTQEQRKPRRLDITNVSGYFVYRFVDTAGVILYVGKTSNIKRRILREHFGSIGHLPKECYTATVKVEFIELTSRAEMDIYEIYLINKFAPKFNIKSNDKLGVISFELPRPTWKQFNHTKNTKRITEEKLIGHIRSALTLKTEGYISKKEISEDLGYYSHYVSERLKAESMKVKLERAGMINTNKYIKWGDDRNFKNNRGDTSRCNLCGKIFTKNSNRQKFCSSCKDEAKRISNRERQRYHRSTKKEASGQQFPLPAYTETYNSTEQNESEAV